MLKVAIDSFSYHNKMVLQDISFTLNPGQHLSVLGENGCGKSTLLHVIYGLLHLDHGKISYNDKELLGPSNTLIPGEPFMKLVAQESNIMPFNTVGENIYSHLSGLDHKKDQERIGELLEIVELDGFKDILAKNLSGGQKQRVALAKALAKAPEILLLDEPFSNIDTFKKNKLSRQIFHYLKSNNISCITATHDSDEALSFSNQIIILKNGQIEMQGSPEYVYQNVETPYLANFFGEVNMLPRNLFDDGHSSEMLLLFPWDLKISLERTKLKVLVKNSYFKGKYYLIESMFNKEIVFFENSNKIEPNSWVWLTRA